MLSVADVERAAARITAQCDALFPDPHPTRARAAAPARRTAGPVIVADDDAMWLRLLRAKLARSLGRLECVTELSDALLAIASRRPVGVVLDWQWPRGSPMVVLEACRQQEIPLIVCTGYPGCSTIPSGLEVVSKDRLSDVVAWIDTTLAAEVGS